METVKIFLYTWKLSKYVDTYVPPEEFTFSGFCSDMSLTKVSPCLWNIVYLPLIAWHVINMAEKEYYYKVPRSFKLRYELDMADKGVHIHESKDKPRAKSVHEGYVSFGLGEINDNAGYDRQLEDWNGTIIPMQNTALGTRIYNVKIKCGPKYPEVPPAVWFCQKINMNGVSPTTGQCDPKVFVPNWTPDHCMVDFLYALRAKQKQPREDERY
eukprot:g27869.t1